ncbi:MAG TPA: polysaccharide biosynthesis C-terminal domain-containing protein, partial [Methanothrix sp.]|nr:polysaccharide biosynthesis C-terminal domain-containing protein [Methanothrix sp.]
SRAYIATITTGVYLPPEQVGFYSATVSITTTLLYAPGVIDRVLLPSFSYSHGKKDTPTVKALLEQATAGLSLVALLMGGVFIILGRDILMILFTPEFSSATFSLQMLVLGVCMYTISLPSVSALSGTEYIKIPNMANLAGLLFSLALWTYLIPSFGINGTALGYVAGAILSSIIPIYFAKRYYNINLKDSGLIIIKSLGAFGVALFAGNIIPKCPDLIISAIFAILFFIIFRKNIAFYFKKIDLSSWH